MSGFISELKRRNVIRMAGLYLVGAWLLTQVSATVLPLFNAPVWMPRGVVIALAIGFIPAMIFSWIYELTPDGLKRDLDVPLEQSIGPETARKLEHLILILFAIALVFFCFDKFVLAPKHEAALVARTLQTAKAETLASNKAAVRDKSIAVLPFVNLSADKEQEYFADGISEELLNLLAKIPELRVIARTSSFSFKDKNVDVATIADKLKVTHILEGSVRKSGDKVRITAQLINAADSSHLWSETYDRQMTDIFVVQDEISAAVVSQLKLKLLGAVPTAKVVDPKAYELLLQARTQRYLGTEDGFNRAIALLKQALDVDPNYAEAWSDLGSVYFASANNGLRPLAEGSRLSREAFNNALVIDSENAPAYAGLAWIAMAYDGDLATAAKQLTRALALAPDDPVVLSVAANLTAFLGRLPSATSLFEQLLVIDPANAKRASNLGLAYYQARRWDESITRYRQALEMRPDALWYHYLIGISLLQKGQPKAAMAEIQREPEGMWRRIGLPMAWHALGDNAKSDESLAILIQRYEKEASYNIATVYAYRGEADKAFSWLDKAVAYQDSGLVDIVVDPLLVNLHSDPRWLPLLHKIGKSPEQLNAIQFEVALPQVARP